MHTYRINRCANSSGVTDDLLRQRLGSIGEGIWSDDPRGLESCGVQLGTQLLGIRVHNGWRLPVLVPHTNPIYCEVVHFLCTLDPRRNVLRAEVRGVQWTNVG